MSVTVSGTEPLHRALGLTDDEWRASPRSSAGSPTTSSSPSTRSCGASTARTSRRGSTCAGSRPRAPGVLVGPGRERRGDRRRRRDRGGHPHREPQPPLGHRALPGGGDRRRGHPARHLHDGRPAARGDGPALLRPARRRRASAGCSRGSSAGISGYGNSVGRADGRRRADLRPLLRRQPARERALPRGAARRAARARRGVGRRATWPCCSARRTGRDGIGGVSACSPRRGSRARTRRRRRRQAAERAGRRPLRGEAAHRGVPRAARRGAGRRASRTSGAPGSACATSETAARGGVGMDVDVAAVPLREPGMAPFEVMTCGEPGADARHRHARTTWTRWPRSVRAGRSARPWSAGSPRRRARRGRPAGGRLRMLDGLDGEVLAEVPAASLADDAPLYDRPMRAARRPRRAPRRRPDDDEPVGSRSRRPARAARRPAWVYRQYDHQLFLNTVVGPGRDAALLRWPARGCPPATRARRHDRLQPALVRARPAGRHRARSWPRAWQPRLRRARPLAVVNCLNFGNPEHPEVMWQLSEAVDGMAEACRGLGLPVIGGNVCLYNESGGADIDPTPVVGVLRRGRRARTAGRPGMGWRRGATRRARRCARAPSRRAVPARRAALGRASGAAGAAVRLPALDLRCPPAARRPGGRAGGRDRCRRRRARLRCPRRVRRRARRRAGRDGAAADAASAPRSGRRTATPSCSPSSRSRVVVATADPTRCVPSARRGRRAASAVLGTAGGTGCAVASWSTWRWPT